MKTAVSIPDRLFKTADRLAKRTKITRSELYARAIDEYVRKRDGDRLTEQANRFADQYDTSMPTDLEQASFEALRNLEP